MTIEELQEKLRPELEKLKKIYKQQEAQGRVVRKLRDKINTITVSDTLGDGELTIDNIMKLDWNCLPTKSYEKVSAWLWKNVKYMHQSGYHPDTNGQPAFYIKMDRGKDVEEQIAEITNIIGLTEWYPADAKYYRLSDTTKLNERKSRFKPFSMFVTADRYDDDHCSYSLRVFEDSKRVVVARNAWVEEKFDTLDEALRFIHKRMWYEDS